MPYEIFYICGFKITIMNIFLIMFLILQILIKSNIHRQQTYYSFCEKLECIAMDESMVGL